jgi:hypothetical protein
VSFAKVKCVGHRRVLNAIEGAVERADLPERRLIGEQSERAHWMITTGKAPRLFVRRIHTKMAMVSLAELLSTGMTLVRVLNPRSILLQPSRETPYRGGRSSRPYATPRCGSWPHRRFPVGRCVHSMLRCIRTVSVCHIEGRARAGWRAPAPDCAQSTICRFVPVIADPFRWKFRS